MTAACRCSCRVVLPFWPNDEQTIVAQPTRAARAWISLVMRIPSFLGLVGVCPALLKFSPTPTPTHLPDRFGPLHLSFSFLCSCPMSSPPGGFGPQLAGLFYETPLSGGLTEPTSSYDQPRQNRLYESFCSSLRMLSRVGEARCTPCAGYFSLRRANARLQSGADPTSALPELSQPSQRACCCSSRTAVPPGIGGLPHRSVRKGNDMLSSDLPQKSPPVV